MRRIPIYLCFALLLLLLINPAFAQESTIPWPTNGWQTASPESQGMNSLTLAPMLDAIAQQHVAIHSVLVIRNGYLVLETYNYPYTADDLHTVYSVTKSFTSALFGIALDQGYIKGVDQPMLDFFPDYTPDNLDASKQAITLENLLTMSPGLEWPGGMGEPLLGEMINDSDDWIQFMLDRPMQYEPGKTFVYNSGVSNLIAAAVAQAAGQPLLDFAKTNLFDLLGIQSVEWAHDPAGRYLGGFGLQLTPRDMAKLGYLYLNNGQWDGKQIVSADWVAASTQKHIDARPLSDGYGYQWWVDIHNYYMAIGYGGQFIIVYPEKNLVAVFTSALSATGGSEPEADFQKYIIPAVESDESLPENPDGVAGLQTAIEALAHPTPTAVPPLPETAAQISGQEYHFETNDLGWESLSMTFDESANTAQLSLNGAPPLNIGLDNVAQVNRVSANNPINAIGFDLILRGYPIIGAEPMLLTGDWPKDNRFSLRVELQGTVNWYQLSLTFKDQDVQVTIRNGLSGSSKSLDGTVT
jgi:CubicO group peptidase (beta-lactamase class C family)